MPIINKEADVNSHSTTGGFMVWPNNSIQQPMYTNRMHVFPNILKFKNLTTEQCIPKSSFLGFCVYFTQKRDNIK